MLSRKYMLQLSSAGSMSRSARLADQDSPCAFRASTSAILRRLDFSDAHYSAPNVLRVSRFQLEPFRTARQSKLGEHGASVANTVCFVHGASTSLIVGTLDNRVAAGALRRFGSRNTMSNRAGDSGTTLRGNVNCFAKNCSECVACDSRLTNIAVGVWGLGKLGRRKFIGPGGRMNDGGIDAATGFESVHSSVPLAPSLAAKNSVVAEDAMYAGLELPAPGRMSLTRTVPATWPLLRQSSTPLVPSLAVNTSKPLRFNSCVGPEPGAPDGISFTIKVPDAEPLPLLFQSSVPLGPLLAAKKTFPLILVKSEGDDAPAPGTRSISVGSPASSIRGLLAKLRQL